jgi:hypothetical protein
MLHSTFLTIAQFLDAYPGETVIARVRHEDDTVQSDREIQTKFAQDVVNTARRVELNVFGLRDADDEMTYQHISKEDEKADTPFPLLGHLRGKLLLLPEAWSHPSLITQTWAKGIKLADEWKQPPSIKAETVKKRMKNASKDNSNTLYVTFISTATPETNQTNTDTDSGVSQVQRNAEILNRELVSFIQNEAQNKGRNGKLGVIMVDHLDKYLADTVINYSLEQHRLVWADWANMPHVTPCTYPKTPKGCKLIYVEVIQRHHQRTPYKANLLPNEDTKLWDATVPAQEAEYPMLTYRGHADSEQHGHDLRRVYSNMLHFLPTYDSSCVSFAVTTNRLTTQVLSSLIKGLFPSVTSYKHEPITDSLSPSYPSPKAERSRANERERNQQKWKLHEAELTCLFEPIDKITGISSEDQNWHVSADHYFDNLSAKIGHGIPIPEGISDGQLQEIRRLGDIDYRMLYGNQEYCTLSYWKYVEEMLQRLEDSGTSSLLYRHNIAHDGSLSRLLGILQDSRMGWPGMGTEVVFEVWEDSDGKRHVRVLKNGEIMASDGRWERMCNIDLTDFLVYYRDMIRRHDNLM